MKQLDMKTKIDTVYRFAFAHSVDGTSDCYLFGCIAYKTCYPSMFSGLSVCLAPTNELYKMTKPIELPLIVFAQGTIYTVSQKNETPNSWP